MATKKLLASIIIDNYNYDRFIGEAIDSALDQTYHELEVIVVDDGSTDNSRSLIAGYGDRIKSIYKNNGGQASAFNAGFTESKGDVIFFLDSDDTLFEDAVKNVMQYFSAGNIAKVQWPLFVVDEYGIKTGGTRPSTLPPEGDYKEVVLENGPTSCVSSPTSGNAWSRSFLEKIFPIPEDVNYYKTCADEYMYTLAPVFGHIKTISEPQGFYRIHGKNIYSALSFDDRMKLELDGHTEQTTALSYVLLKYGYSVDKNKWKHNSWFHRLHRAKQNIESSIPVGSSFILVDNATWDAKEMFPNYKVRSFIEREGKQWGSPESDEQALEVFKNLYKNGFLFIVFAWPSFWWFQQYPALYNYLRLHFSCVVENGETIIFDLSKDIFKDTPLVSIIVNNYNYGKFINEAIDSALNQAYKNIEVIVVDDGSTDNSKEIIEKYGSKIIPVFKENGGQGSAFNEGFLMSKGSIILFLDSDDMLLPDAVDRVRKAFDDYAPVKVHWSLQVIDEAGNLTEEIIPTQTPPDGNLQQQVLCGGPFYDWHLTPPTSGNAWAKWYLKKVLPMPDNEFRLSADEYLLTLAPAYGIIKTLLEPVGYYRVHGSNNYFQQKLDERTVQSYKTRFESCCVALQGHFKLAGINANIEDWKKNNFNYLWLERLQQARDDIKYLIPANSTLVLIDGNQLGKHFTHHCDVISFLECDGQYYGEPESDEAAIEELERLKINDVPFIVFWWTSFWWFDHYSKFAKRLAFYQCVLQNDRLVIFDLSKQNISSPGNVVEELAQL